ncbi:MAG: DUF2155 domain-containing protein [Alphaproteobacteria bacterium]|nr:DUF2155 domain-containing protein [Alphaproteobacteria bacterium]MBN2675233.1 DUF2155 domain-containing protein [Alphaproteobacteria bacterium]
MKITKLLFLLTVPFLFASLSDANAYIEKKTAVVRIMNKAAGKSQTITIPVRKQTNFEKLTLTVRTCKQTDPFQPEDFFMFIEILKKSEGRIFSNWMSRNEPGDNPLQNADYDLWLVKCE